MITTVRGYFNEYIKHLSRAAALALVLASLAMLTSCEDDPILPDSETEEGGGGSYGKMRLADPGYHGVDSLYEKNPEVY